MQEFDPKITQLNFFHGHWLDITNELLLLDTTADFRVKRYPAIMVQHDFEETSNPRPGIISSATIRVIIAYPTKQTYFAKDRIALIYKPLLNIIHEAFINEVGNSGYFVLTNGFVKHKVTDRLYWGKQEANGNKLNSFNEYLDCKDITFELELQKNNNCSLTNFI
jgi:hypothetical protein